MSEVLDQAGEIVLDQADAAVVDQTSGTSFIEVPLWSAQAANPRTIRQLYHWVWSNLSTRLSAYFDALNEFLQALIAGRNRWMGTWGNGEYLAFDQVIDDGWLMIANKTTTDRAAPQPQGSPAYIYGLTNTVTQETLASQVIFGQRYTGQSGTLRVSGYRLFTVIGNTYRIFAIENPLTADPIISEVSLFTATNAGWQNFTVSGRFVGVGETFDLIALVQEPDPSPTTFQGDWSYSTPQNPGIPDAGEIIHSRSQPATMNISSTDANAGDRYAELAGLDFGDIIDDGTIRWAIQSVTDNTTYFTFGVSPAVNSVTGTNTYTFETVSPTPISYEEDADYWVGQPLVQGLLGIDEPYDQLIPDESQYGLDIQVQDYDFSEDWDIQSAMDGGGGSATQQLTVGETIWVASQAGALDLLFGDATGPMWAEIGRRFVPDQSGYRIQATVEGKRQDAFGYFYGDYRAAVQRDGTIDLSVVTIIEESPSSQTGIRVVVDGDDVVFEGRCNPGQQWDFKVIAYFNYLGDLL